MQTQALLTEKQANDSLNAHQKEYFSLILGERGVFYFDVEEETHSGPFSTFEAATAEANEYFGIET
jgi:hypothetical protein